MYIFDYNLYDSDYLEFNKFHHRISPTTQKIFYVLTAICALGCLIIFFGQGRYVVSVILFAIVAGITFGFKHIITLILKININSLKKKGKLPFGKTVKIHFDRDYIHEISEMAESKVNYENIEKIAEEKHGVYVYIGAIQAFIIPHRAFASQQQKSEFLSFINEKVPAK